MRPLFFSRAATCALAAFVALGVGPSTAPHEPAPAEATAPWEPVSYIEDAWAGLPFADHAELVVADLEPATLHGQIVHPRGEVHAENPSMVFLDRSFVESVPPEDARELLGVAVHELSHSAVFQSGEPIPDDLLLDADDTWASRALGLDPQRAAGEALAACVQQAGLPEGTPSGYLSGECPADYLARSFEYLASITGEDWRPRELRAEAGALGQFDVLGGASHTSR